MAAVCTVKLTGSASETMAVLLPLVEEENQSPPNHLLLFKLPFADDIKNLSFDSFSSFFKGADSDGEENNDLAGKFA